MTSARWGSRTGSCSSRARSPRPSSTSSSSTSRSGTRSSRAPRSRSSSSRRTWPRPTTSAGDGSGYLQGLHGEEIPLAGRITAIADTFDALVSRRVYKAPIALDSALAVIEDGRGEQFDPELVDMFLACRADVAEIVAAHPDHDLRG